jgi:8-oxo-dGTP diphosphatase
VSVVYYALVPPMAQDTGANPAVEWRSVDRLPPLPFDHAEIVRQALARVRSKSQYSSLPVHLCGERFTLPQLKLVYEAVLGERVNQVSFRRRMDELGMLEPVAGEMVGGAHRPAQVWRVKAAHRTGVSLSARVLGGER